MENKFEIGNIIQYNDRRGNLIFIGSILGNEMMGHQEYITYEIIKSAEFWRGLTLDSGKCGFTPNSNVGLNCYVLGKNTKLVKLLFMNGEK